MRIAERKYGPARANYAFIRVGLIVMMIQDSARFHIQADPDIVGPRRCGASPVCAANAVPTRSNFGAT